MFRSEKVKINKNITGIILSGGKSIRMGSNKSLLKLGDKTLIERTIDLMLGCFEKNIIITNEPNLYEFLDVEMYEDIIPNLGPLSGIHSGLVNSTTEKNFVISCDMPMMSNDIVNYIATYKSGKQIVIPFDGENIQQMCGIYSKNIIDQTAQILTDSSLNKNNMNKKTSVHELLNLIEHEVLDVSELPFFNSNLFLNMNNIDDYKMVLDLI